MEYSKNFAIFVTFTKMAFLYRRPCVGFPSTHGLLTLFSSFPDDLLGLFQGNTGDQGKVERLQFSFPMTLFVIVEGASDLHFDQSALLGKFIGCDNKPHGNAAEEHNHSDPDDNSLVHDAVPSSSEEIAVSWNGPSVSSVCVCIKQASHICPTPST